MEHLSYDEFFELYGGDGGYGDQTPTDQKHAAYAWSIIRDLLSKCGLSSLGIHLKRNESHGFVPVRLQV